MFPVSLVVLMVLVAVNVQAGCDKFCASFNPRTADGASGYVALSIGNGRAVDLSLDLTDFDITCDLSQGLKYHVHTYWNNATVDSSANTFCGASFTGGHYDPNFACSSVSQAISNECVTLGRVTPDYVYNCTKSLYNEGKYSYCEIGDISGKAGIIYPESDSKQFKLSCPFVDFLPLYAANYNFSDTNSLPWTSIVFHCAATNARLVCAKFSPSDMAACDYSFSQFSRCASTHKSDNGGSISQGQYSIAVIVSVFFCLIAGTCFGVLVGKFQQRALKPASYEVLDFDA